MFEVAQPAVDQLGRFRRRALREVARLQQQHPRAAPGGIARDPRAIDAAADDDDIIGGGTVGHRFPMPALLDLPRGRHRMRLTYARCIRFVYPPILRMLSKGTKDRKSTRLNSSH